MRNHAYTMMVPTSLTVPWRNALAPYQKDKLKAEKMPKNCWRSVKIYVIADRKPYNETKLQGNQGTGRLCILSGFFNDGSVFLGDAHLGSAGHNHADAAQCLTSNCI